MWTLVTILIALVIAYLSTYILRYETARFDGVTGEIIDALTESQTIYGADYSHFKFSKVRLGMSQDSVKLLVGEPLAKFAPPSLVNRGISNNEEIWYYSESPNSSHFRMRNLMIVEGRVAEVVANYYID